MMKRIILSLFLITNLFNTILGCSCYDINSFNLKTYDESVNIIEIKVIEKIEDNFEERQIQYPKDTIDSNKKTLRKPLRPPNKHTMFKVEIIEVFKGKTSNSTREMRANERTSSCYWEPEIGSTYIYYLDKATVEGSKKIFELFGCERKIEINANNYKTEQNTLRLLKEKKEGAFKIDQTNLLAKKHKKYISLQGKFKNGKRHGQWIIAEPIGKRINGFNRKF